MPDIQLSQRSDPKFAGAVIDSIFQGTSRGAKNRFLAFLASSIDWISSKHSDRWEITLFPKRIRLNIGSVECLDLHKSGLRVLLYSRGKRDYDRTPDCTMKAIQLDGLVRVLPTFEKLHIKALSIAAKNRLSGGWADAHSTGVTGALSERLHRAVPDPSYVTQKKLHLLNGGYDNDDEQMLVRAAKRNEGVGSWVVPKSAAVGDEVVINVARRGLFATGRIASRTSLRADWNGRRYGARLNSIKLIKPPIAMKAVQDAIPGLGWARYPRSIATPSTEIAKKIRELFSMSNSNEFLAASDSVLEEESLDELRASALGSATRLVEPEERKVIYRRRSKAIHLYVLRRANGRCEGCKKAGPFRTVSGSVYLEPHHIKRLADNGPDHPSRVIALCPNCHRRAHYGEDAKSFNSLLTRKLVEIEHRNN